MELNRILCGDNVAVLETFPSESIDLVVTSPPYDNLRDYTGYAVAFPALVAQLVRVLKQGGVLVWVVGDATVKGSETGTSFRQALAFLDAGLRLHDTMIYEKNTSSFPAKRAGTRYTQIFEYMFVLSKGTPAHVTLLCDKENKWAGWTNWGKNTTRAKDGTLEPTTDIKPVPTHSPRTNIWKYVVGKGFNSSDKESHEHPAIFPEKLAEDHILTWSREGDVVLDPFCGSGTTCKMAKRHRRSYLGIDISSEYCTLAERILAKY